jgi:cob(I)alamin adenosyltransferase
MSIVTKTGDAGETSLMYGRRIPKTDPRVEAYGSVDELTAALGLARASTNDESVSNHILEVQKELIHVMGELATAPEDLDRYVKDGFQVTSAAMVERVTGLIQELEKDKSLYPKDWVIPGRNFTAAALDLGRTICRRAERHVSALENVNPEVLRYLNRLSDYCWILARSVEKKLQT